MTVLSVPHLALGGELSDNPQDRTELFGWRLFFSNIGILVGMLLPAILIETFGNIQNKDSIFLARKVTSIIIGLVVVFSGTVTFLVTGSKQIKLKPHFIRKDLGILKKIPLDFRQAIHNKVFLPLFIAFVVATFGRTFNTSIALFYYKFRLGLEEPQIIIGILLPFFLVIIASIPLWVWLSKKYGKKYPAFWGIFVLGILTMIAYPLYPYGNQYYPLITAVIGGICSGSIFLLDSLVADIVDYDELITGEMKEGLYFGIWKMGTKFAQAIGLALSGIILDWIGLIPGETNQPEYVSYRLAMVFGPLVGFFFAIGSIIFLWMPLNQDNYLRIQKLLEKKRKHHQKSLDISK